MRRRTAVALALVLAAYDGPVNHPTDATPALCDPVLPTLRDAYSDADAPIPSHFLASTEGTVAFTDNTPSDNPITNAGATLGRVLFYDTRLSWNDGISCASCHRQAFGFADTTRFSAGLYGRRPMRHTMALANARFNDHGRFRWDEGAPSLEAQVLTPIEDTTEMGTPLDTLERKLARTVIYPALFAAAFGSPEVTRERVAAALAQFVRSLVSTESRYDAVFATGGAPAPDRLTSLEREGHRLFIAVGCVNCHRTIAQIADKASDNGLDSEPFDPGAGEGRFKPPSLRNVAVRPPYMHDGRFTTLRQVIDFYNAGVQPGRFLDPRLAADDGSPRRLGLDSSQVTALVAFLETLTDSTFLTARKFSDPFPCHDDR